MENLHQDIRYYRDQLKKKRDEQNGLFLGAAVVGVATVWQTYNEQGSFVHLQNAGGMSIAITLLLFGMAMKTIIEGQIILADIELARALHEDKERSE